MTPRLPSAAAPFRVFFVPLLLAAPLGWAATPDQVGQWSTVYTWPNVAIHLALLPDGRVMSYADDDNPNYNTTGARLAGFTKTYLIDVPNGGAPGTVTYIPNQRSNMFCSGHTFMADGRLYVIGGHLGKDGWGEPRSEFFDYRDESNWWPGPDMHDGRWYPSACELANGDLLAISGSMDSTIVMSQIPEVLSGAVNGGWRQLTGANLFIPYYPFTILAPDGRVFVAGPHPDARYLDCTGSGAWSATAYNHILNQTRSYASCAQYGDGKILVAGGNDPPTNTCEVIDLNSPTPTWTSTGSMSFNRRQLNLTILPDGNVLASGGTSGAGFDNNTGAVLSAEMWTPPPVGTWTAMASMAKARIYHSTTVLLPDGRVLSAGSGRPKPDNGGVDQLNAEIYSPPYLFKGARPTITSAPAMVSNGVGFTITTPNAASIMQVTMIKLSSTTHSFNQGQRFNRLNFSVGSGLLTATVPASPNLAPPGFYLLFILNSSGVPSIAKMIQVLAPGPVGVSDSPDAALLDFLALRSENPMHGGTARIAFSVAHSEVGRVEILDVQGRRVRVVADGFFDAGRERVVTWDGTDEHGQRVRSGLYWYRLTTPSVTRTGKLALLSY